MTVAASRESQQTLGRDLLDALRAACGADAVLYEPDELLVFESDANTLEKGVPRAVVFPRDTRQAAAVARQLSAHDLPLVPRGAGTGLAGGCVDKRGGVVVCTSRMNRILRLDARGRRAHVQAGVLNQQLSDAARPLGLHFAPDPASQVACTIGGNVATNAGGPHTLCHGVTVNHVLGLTCVLPGGEAVVLGGECDSIPGFDLLGAFVGSEGTFGLITEVVVRLSRVAPAVRTLLAAFDDFDRATRVVSEIIAAGELPVALELMDRTMVNVVEDVFGFGLPRSAEAILLIEIEGVAAGLDDKMQRIVERCRAGGASRLDLARDEEHRARLWLCRKRAFGAVGRISPAYCTQDGVVPRSRLPEMLRYIREVAAEVDLRIVNVFHAGDGNVHPGILYDPRRPEQVQRMFAASERILRRCVELGGSVSGEHGIGLEKRNYLPFMYGPDDLAAMRRLRDAIDPRGLANPGTMFHDRPDPDAVHDEVRR